MHNTYVSSGVFSIRTNGSLSFTFGDCSNMFNGGFERNPLLASRYCGGGGCCCCSCCCSCCGALNANFRGNLNPSLLYGLRQSSLIQRSPSRRLIFGGRERHYCRVPGYGIESCDSGVSCSFKERNVSERSERKGKGRFERVNLRGRRLFSGVDDVDAVISLLSEEVIGECSVDGGRKWSSLNRVEMEKVDKRESYGGEFHSRRRSNKRLEELEGVSKDEDELASIKLRKEKCSQSEERDKRQERKEYPERQEREEGEEQKAVLRGDNRRGRKASSSFSSYYSLSSSGEFETDKEAQDEQVDFLEGSSSRYGEEVGSRTNRYEGRVKEEFKSHKGSIEGEREVLEYRENAARTGVEWDLRKKTEKKLTEIEETQFKKEDAESHSRISRVRDSNSREASSLYEQIHNKEETSSLAVDLDKRKRKEFSEATIGVSEQAAYERKYHEVANAQEIHGRSSKLVAHKEKKVSGREENQSLDDKMIWERRNSHYELGGERTQKDNLGKERQHLIKISEIRDADAGDARQQRLSGSRLKIQEEDGVARDARDANELHYQKADQLAGRIDSRSSKKFSTLISSHDGHSNKTSILQSGTSAKNQEDIGSVASGSRASRSSSDSKACKPDRDQINLEMIQLSQESQDITNISLNVTNVSVVHAETAKDQRAAERKRMDSLSASKPIQQRTEVISVDESLTRLKARNERENTSNPLGSHEEMSQGTLVTESSSGVVSGEEAYGTERNGENYRNTSIILSPEDALSSAQHSDETSLQFVGEFVEKARHELSTSKIVEEKMLSDRKMVSESEINRHKSLDKEQDIKSSVDPGVKGPSDEMWDMRDPSIQEPQELQAMEEGAKSDNIVVRRTGKSLWSTIANAFRLRWSSHAETSTSAKKSGGKSSSNDSVGSEAWFSGNEPDENSDENVRSERSKPHEAIASDKLKQRQSSPRGQGDVSDTRRQLKSDLSLPLVPTKSASTSAVSSSPSDEGNLAHGQENLPSGLEIGGSSHMLSPTVAMSGHIGEENLVTGEIAVASIVSASETEQPIISKSTEELLDSEGNQGQLKQRKLQRNKQVLRDRFDAWEEAYIFEKEQRKMDEMFMREALLEGKKAGDLWEVPVGAVLVKHGNIIARGHNLVEELRDSTAHAEMICIREASNQLRSWRLADTTLYVTLEPCPMCAGAILQARINTLVWGAPNKLLGADGSWIRLFPNGGSEPETSDKPAAPVHPFHPNMTIRRGILASDCADVMQRFFQLRRRKREKEQKDEEHPPQPSCLPVANRQSKILTKMHDIFHSTLCL